MPSPEMILVVTSVATEAQADALTQALLEQRLAACVQQTTGVSSYHWDGRIEQSQEYYLHIKTTVELKQKLLAWLHVQHPYEVPEILWSVVHAQDDYMSWLQRETAQS